MKKITLTDFERNQKTTNRWLGLLVLCVVLLFGPFTSLYGQGQTCGNPLNVMSLPYTFSGNTSAYGDDYESSNIPALAIGAITSGSSHTFYLSGDDAVFSITPSTNGSMNISTSFTATYGGVFVFTGCPFASTLGYAVSSEAGLKEIANLPVLANTTYYIVVSTWTAPQSSAFTLNITGTPGLLTPPENCTGTPSAGTATITPNGGNAGSSFEAKATGVTFASGLEYQWQKNTTGSWQDITGATAVNSTITAESGAIGTVTNYRLKVSCVASNETAYSSEAIYTISLVYCTPTGNGNNADEMVNFTLNNLNNTSAPSDGVAGYKDYSGIVAPAQLQLGVPYTASVKAGTGSGNHGAAIWIDYNGNGTFEDSEKVAFIGNTITPNAVASFPEFIVPEGTALGVYRLRVQYQYNKSGELLVPCSATSTNSETEDYSVEVLPVPTCLQPVGLTASMITSATANLSWTSAGTLFDIEFGPQGFVQGAGTSITGVSSPYTLNQGLLPVTSYSYYVRQNCGEANGFSLWSGPYTFTTACALVTSFTENFDSYTANGALNPLPNCWSRTGNTGSSYITTGSTTPMSPSNRLYLSGSATGATNGVAVMPEVSNLSAGTNRLRFKAFATTADKSLEIGYYELDNPTNFVVTGEIEIPVTTAATAMEFSYIPEFIPQGIQAIAFRANGGAFEGTTTIYIDDVTWEIQPLCADLSDVVINDVTSSTANIEWYSEGTESAWDYVYAVNTVTSPVGLTPITVNDNPFFTLEDLASSTTYNFWVRSNCGSGNVGTWSVVQSFTTLCAAVTSLPWTEGFEGITTVGTTSFPACWLKENGDWATALVGTYNTPKSGTKYLRNSWSATNEFMWTTGFELTAGESYDFSFYMQGDGSTGWNVDVFQNTAQSSVNAVQLGEMVTATGPGSLTMQEYQLVKNTFTPAASGIYYFAIRVNQGSSLPYYIAFDDFKLEITPTCKTPVTETVINITDSSATATWSSESTASNGFEYFLTTDATIIPDAATVPTGTVEGTASLKDLTGLTAQTTYKFYIRALCTTSDISSWSAARTFTTTCSAVTIFSENFDTSLTGSSNPLPTCWSRAGNATTYVTTGGVTPGSAPNRLYMSASGSATIPTVGYAIMPPVSNLEANTHRLKFKAYASAANRFVEIGYLTNTTDLSTFQLLETIDLPGTTAASAQTLTFESALIPSGIKSLVFRNSGISTGSTDLYIDDVVWEVKPSNAPTCTTNILATTNVTCGNFATVLSWNANEATDGYYLSIGTTAGGVDVLNNQNIGAVTSYNFIGEIATDYYFTVVPFNSAGSATGCVEQTFTTAENGCYCTSVPTSNDGAGITNVVIGTQNFANGDVMYFDHTATTVDLAQGLEANLKVTFATGFTYGTNVWIDLNDNFTFEEDELVFSGESLSASPTTLNASFFMDADANLGTHRMRIVATDIVQVPANPCYNSSYGVTLEFSVNIIPLPTCLAPAGVTVDATMITPTAASVTWTASSSVPALGYEYFYTTTNDVPTAATIPTGSVAAAITTANLTDLSPATTYKIYVRAVCSATDFSAWSQSATFLTNCASSALPYTIDFESATVPNLPTCTYNQNVGTGNNWITANNPGFGFTSKVLRYAYNSSNAANAWFFTNSVDLIAGTQYSITYNYGTNSTTFVEKFKIAFGTSATSTSMTTEIFDHSNVTGNTLQNNTATFTPTVSGTYTIGFNVYSETDQNSLFIDNIIIQEALATGDFTNNKFTVYPNPVKDNLNIRYNENIDNVAIFNLLGQQVIVKNINATEGKVDMSNLSTGTYLIKVTSGEKVQTIKVIKE